jgi:hypothetical protein
MPFKSISRQQTGDRAQVWPSAKPFPIVHSANARARLPARNGSFKDPAWRPVHQLVKLPLPPLPPLHLLRGPIRLRQVARSSKLNQLIQALRCKVRTNNPAKSIRSGKPSTRKVSQQAQSKRMYSEPSFARPDGQPRIPNRLPKKQTTFWSRCKTKSMAGKVLLCLSHRLAGSYTNQARQKQPRHRPTSAPPPSSSSLPFLNHPQA